MNRKGMFVVAAVMVLGSVETYQPIPGIKTVWGEKVTPENAWREEV